MAKPLKYIQNRLLTTLATRPVLLAFASMKFASARRSRSALGKVNDEWRQRIQDVLACPDNGLIPRHAEAGNLDGGLVTMHNGLRVGSMGYYGGGILNMLVQSKGVHEPQEERVFQDILPHIKPGGSILELGAYWGFYSLWFATEVADARCYLVEPNIKSLASGMMNFKLNGKRGDFSSAYAGAKPGMAGDGIRVMAVDDYCKTKGIDHLSILHADIQGAEREMLDGAVGMIDRRAIDYIFISTHSNELHTACVGFLQDHGYTVIASADMDDTYSFDGLIVAQSPDMQVPGAIEIALKSKA